MGAGGAFATICYLRCTTSWCQPQYRSIADGSLTIGVMLGSFCADAPLAVLIQKYNLHIALMAMFFLGLFLTALIYLLLKDGSYMHKNAKIAIGTAYLDLIKKKENWYLTAYSGFAFSPLAVFGGLWGTPFLQTADHFNKPIAAGLVSLAYIGFGIGGPIFGLLADWFRKRIHLMFCGLFITGISLLIIIYMPMMNKIALASLMILLGFGTGGFMLGFSVGKALNNILLAGSIVALINSGDAILGAITEPLIGHFLDLGMKSVKSGLPIFSLGNYQHAFIILLGYIVVPAFFLWRLKGCLPHQN